MITSEDLERARTNVFACAYNAAVNYGSERHNKKMWDLIRAINLKLRVEGALQLQALVEAGVIETFTPCPEECQMRPGGLFHADGCENEMNHPVYRARQQKARETLPGGTDGKDGWRATSVSLVGEYDVGEHYRREQVAGIARMLVRAKNI